jgi:hypothetical protein
MCENYAQPYLSKLVFGALLFCLYPQQRLMGTQILDLSSRLPRRAVGASQLANGKLRVE